MIRRLPLRPRRRLRARARRPRPALAAEEPKTDPTKEFILEPWIEIPKLGPIDLSITKAVFYLFLSTAILLIGALSVARHLKLHPKKLQAFVEIIYDFSETQIGRASLPAKTYKTWFPYLATLFLFIWINNMISYLPLPVDTRAQDLRLAADAELLRDDLEHLGHARADARHVLRVALRRHPAQRRAGLLRELVPARRRRRSRS